MPPSVLEAADELDTAVGVCTNCAELIQADMDGCPNLSIGDDAEPHDIRWFATPKVDRFPLDSYREAARYLRRPFTKEAVKWKVQSAFGNKGFLVVAYIDARLVIERLNLIVPHLWEPSYDPLGDGSSVICRLMVDGITREDIGRGSGPEAMKGARSDALKRAAVHFGVGVSVYAIPRAEIWQSDEDRKSLYTYKHVAAGNGKKEQHIYRLTPAGERSLREMYAAWLEQVGVRAFGEPIDHGDVEDSAGEAPGGGDESAATSDLPAVQMPLVDEKADALRTLIRTEFARVQSLPKGKSRLPKARFESELAGASKSHEDLESYLTSLTDLAKELS